MPTYSQICVHIRINVCTHVNNCTHTHACVYTLKNACTYTCGIGHSVFLNRDIIYKDIVSLRSASVQILHEAENMLIVSRMYACVRAWTHVSVCERMFSCMYARVRSCMYVCMRKFEDACVCIYV